MGARLGRVGRHRALLRAVLLPRTAGRGRPDTPPPPLILVGVDVSTVTAITRPPEDAIPACRDARSRSRLITQNPVDSRCTRCCTVVDARGQPALWILSALSAGQLPAQALERQFLGCPLCSCNASIEIRPGARAESSRESCPRGDAVRSAWRDVPGTRRRALRPDRRRRHRRSRRSPAPTGSRPHCDGGRAG